MNQLLNPSHTEDYIKVPTKVEGFCLKEVQGSIPKDFSTGLFHNVALTEMGSVLTWGSNYLGKGEFFNECSPRVLRFPNSKMDPIERVWSGKNVNFAKSLSNDLYMWGCLPGNVQYKKSFIPHKTKCYLRPIKFTADFMLNRFSHLIATDKNIFFVNTAQKARIIIKILSPMIDYGPSVYPRYTFYLPIQQAMISPYQGTSFEEDLSLKNYYKQTVVELALPDGHCIRKILPLHNNCTHKLAILTNYNAVIILSINKDGSFTHFLDASYLDICNSGDGGLFLLEKEQKAIHHLNLNSPLKVSLLDTSVLDLLSKPYNAIEATASNILMYCNG